LVNKKYQILFSRKTPRKPGRKSPSEDLVNLIIEMKTKNPSFGYLRIAMQIQNSFNINLDKGVVRRVLDKNVGPKKPSDNDPSWLSFIGNTKNSLWSVDLFRCESILLKSHWVMIVMDQFTRKIIDFSVHIGDPDGIAVCCMFNRIMAGQEPPKYLSTDNDPLFKFHRWQANVRILDVKEIKSVPYTLPLHPYVERLIGTIRRECLDNMIFWNDRDLIGKLGEFKAYYNEKRAHSSLSAVTPNEKAGLIKEKLITIENYRWKSHANGLFQLPIAA